MWYKNNKEEVEIKKSIETIKLVKNWISFWYYAIFYVCTIQSLFHMIKQKGLAALYKAKSFYLIKLN